jgi:hypothetical protein
MKILYQNYFEQALHKSRFTNPEKFVSHAGVCTGEARFKSIFSLCLQARVQSGCIRLFIN